MPTPDEFRTFLLDNGVDAALDQFILQDEAANVSSDERKLIRCALANRYSIQPEEVSVCIVGSAKLGFSLTEKQLNGVARHRYRLFDAYSDIDVAVISPKIFAQIW
jgi:hypothetical protein